MNHDEAVRRLRTLTYKPGYDFSVEGDPSRIVLRLTFMAPNARRAGAGETQVSYTCVLEPRSWHTEGHLHAAVRAFIRRLELHELNEWLAFDGRLMNDPHAPGVDPDKDHL